MDNYNEAIIVNKFKKTMKLYNAGNRKVDVLVPRHPSAGNRIDKQSGKAVFFFSTIEEAKKYAVGKGLTTEYNEYLSEVSQEIKKMKKTDPKKAEIATKHIAFISKMTHKGHYPPVFRMIGVHMKYYGLDDRKVCPEYPFCWNFIERVKKSTMPLYIRIANVPTEDIKHGHSSNYREFTVFKQVKVDECKEFTLGQLFRQTNVTYFKNMKDYPKYMKIVTKNIDKDIFRAVISYRDFRKRLTWDDGGKHNVPEIHMEEEYDIMTSDLAKLLESNLYNERKWGDFIDKMSNRDNFVLTESMDESDLYECKKLVYRLEDSLREFSANVFKEDLSNKLGEKLDQIHDKIEESVSLQEIYKYKKQINIINQNINKKLANNNIL